METNIVLDLRSGFMDYAWSFANHFGVVTKYLGIGMGIIFAVMFALWLVWFLFIDLFSFYFFGVIFGRKGYRDGAIKEMQDRGVYRAYMPENNWIKQIAAIIFSPFLLLVFSEWGLWFFIRAYAFVLFFPFYIIYSIIRRIVTYKKEDWASVTIFRLMQLEFAEAQRKIIADKDKEIQEIFKRNSNDYNRYVQIIEVLKNEIKVMRNILFYVINQSKLVASLNTEAKLDQVTDIFAQSPVQIYRKGKLSRIAKLIVNAINNSNSLTQADQELNKIFSEAKKMRKDLRSLNGDIPQNTFDGNRHNDDGYLRYEDEENEENEDYSDLRVNPEWFANNKGTGQTNHNGRRNNGNRSRQ